MLALIRELITTGRADTGFLTKYTAGWETLKAYVEGRTDGTAKTAEWAEKITGVQAASSVNSRNTSPKTAPCS